MNHLQNSSSNPASVLAVTDVPPQLNYPNGYSARMYHFLKGVATLWPLDVLALKRDDEVWTAKNFLPSDLSTCHFWVESIPTQPLNVPGMRGRSRRLKHYLFDSLPYMSHPRQSSHLHRHLGQHFPGLAIFHLPYMVHLSFQLPQSVPCVYILEEGWERALDWMTRDLPKPLRMWVKTSEIARTHRLYRQIVTRKCRVIAISDSEKEWFSNIIPENLITTIPHGLDCEYYAPTDAQQDIDISVFGIFSGGANLEAALDLYEQIESSLSEFPICPKWAFVGKDPHDSLLALRCSRVTVTGFVPDVRPYYARTKVVIVPAQYGGGVKTTVLQAWAMGRPLVATPFALTGLPARHGENVLISNSPKELVQNVSVLLASSELRDRIGRAGRETVSRERNIRTFANDFVELCKDILKEHSTTTSNY